ncbi:MAG: hypothetical protein ACYC99_02755 [Candidatus Geothermincolia bacterium]
MEHAFQSIASSSLSLFGLVMATLAFGYGAAMRELKDTDVFRSFSKWLWTAGVCCCVYYSYCFLVTSRQLYSSFSSSFLALMLVTATVILAVGHFTEAVFLHRLCSLDMKNMKWIFVSQTSLASFTFAAFLFLNWRVFFVVPAARPRNLFIALIFTLILISFRAVFLVGFSFYSVIMLQRRRNMLQAPEQPATVNDNA